ncbi:MAG: TIGR04438 family Trp-rich protein [Burkholderiales bacterium]|nr:MAG: TIGR04438 family Trp-rich protein [Burkholderiales bacterium]
MPLLWIGVLLVLLRWLEVGPFADLSWWWVLAPLVLCFAWFETFERIFGQDKRQIEAAEWEKRRKERVAAQFPQKAPPRR